MSGEGPLRNKRIVITRAAEQAREFKQRLEALGAEVLLAPAVHFSEPSDTTELDRAIRSIATFDWILFTSANAVRFFAMRCRELGSEIPRCGKPLLAAVGPATAGAAAAAGWSTEFVSYELTGVALAREMADVLTGKCVLLPRSDRARRDLPDALRAADADVTEVIAYQTGGMQDLEPKVLEALREARVDVISFFSPSAVENLRAAIGAEAFSRLAGRAAFGAVGPVTAAALGSAGTPARFEAAEASAASMTLAIQNYFAVKE